jgi:ribosomal subunit interface protein
MKINITSRHFKAKESLQELINSKIEELSKYNEDILHADVILFYDKPPLDIKHCEVSIKLKDKILTSKESAEDFERAVDRVIEKIDKQIYKYKDKHKAKKHNNPAKYKSI